MNLNLFKYLQTILLGFILTSFCNATELNIKQRTKPNVIIILADDLGYADLGCQGSIDVNTPHIDKLAENGIRFTSGYVTAPQCGPSRAGLLTGRYQNRFGLEANQVIDRKIEGQKVISEYMKEAGYTTGIMGKWGVSKAFDTDPPQKGFDVAYWNRSGNIYYTPTPGGHDTQFYKNNEKVDLKEYSTDAIGREAVAFIENHYEEPFFLYIPFITPHLPMQSKKEDFDYFPEAKDSLRRTFLGMMKCMDDHVGNIMNTLRVKGIEEETLVIFLSDNGGYRGNTSSNLPFSGGKTQMLEGGIRIPFIMQWKDEFKPGQVYDHPVISIDLLPTVVAVAGGKTDDNIDGVNLIPYLTEEKKEAPHEALYWRFNHEPNGVLKHGFAIRKGDWKLVENGFARTPVALYNLAMDPIEKKDLSNNYPEKVAMLMAMWNEWNTFNDEQGSVK